MSKITSNMVEEICSNRECRDCPFGPDKHCCVAVRDSYYIESVYKLLFPERNISDDLTMDIDHHFEF